MEKRVAIVTGVADGIGKVVTERLLDTGYAVVGMDNRAEHLEKTAGEFSVRGDFIAQTTDVLSYDAVHSAIERTFNEKGRIDILVNNVGGSGAISRPMEEISLEEWEMVLNLNIKSTFLCIHAVLPYMKNAKWGRIVNMSSMAGRSRSYFGGVPYATAKAALIGMVRQGSREMAPFGITINAVAPGVIVASERIRKYWETARTEKDREELIKSIPAGRTGTGEDVAAAVAYLVSEDASYVTGTVLDVNGGIWVG
jgi:3-oxoacyl-[acyl-carrier protein] reductase